MDYLPTLKNIKVLLRELSLNNFNDNDNQDHYSEIMKIKILVECAIDRIENKDKYICSSCKQLIDKDDNEFLDVFTPKEDKEIKEQLKEQIKKQPKKRGRPTKIKKT